MLVLSQTFIGRNVMSLRTGRPVAIIDRAIINPNNLFIEGFYCTDSLDKKQRLILVRQDIRDILPAGIVVDDHGVLAEEHDLVRLQPLLKLGFELFGMPVVLENGKRLGKVTDYATDDSSFFVKKLYISQSMLKSITGGNVGIDRSQIVEITNRKIVVKDPLQTVPSGKPALRPSPAN